MKKKSYKIMGMALTVMLLASLAVGLVAAPAGAGNLEWDKEEFPRAADLGDYFRDTAITGLGPWTMAIDGTMHAYAAGTGLGMLVSTDSGRSWDMKSPGYGGTAPVGIAVSTEDADTLWVASATGVYRSTNGGGSFTLLTDTDDQGGTLGSITALTAGYVDDEPYLFVAATSSAATVPDIFVLGASYGSIWSAMNVPAENIHAIACAPDFNTYSDPVVFAIVSDDAADAFTMTCTTAGLVTVAATSGSVTMAVTTEAGATATTIAAGVITFGDVGDIVTVTASANSTAGTITNGTGASTNVVSVDADSDAGGVGAAVTSPFSLPDGDSDVAIVYKKGGGAWSAPSGLVLYSGGTAPTNADIAFPDDFNSSSTSSSHEYVVTINDGAGSNGGVYRVVSTSVVSTPTTTDCFSVDMAGDVGDYWVVVGTTAGGTKYSSDGAAEVFSSSKTDDGPGGSGNADVLVAQDFLDSQVVYALVTGGNMALSRSTNKGSTWNDISLIDTDVTAVNDLAFGGSDRYMATTGAGNDSLWKYDGSNWERVTNGTNIDRVQASPEYGSDESVFYADLAGNQIYRANDGGNRFRAQLGQPALAITGWLVVDDSTIIVGVNGKTYRTINNGTTWSSKATGLSTADNIINFARSPDYDSDSTLLCSDDAGNVFRSTNGGGSYSAITEGGFGGTGTSPNFPTFVAFDADYADNATFYAAGTNGTDMVVERYEDGDEWRSIFDSDATSSYTTTGATGMVVSEDGTLYLSDGTDTGIFRCLNPTASPTSLVEWMNVTRDCSVQLNNLVLTSGSNKIWGSNAADVWTYVDTMTGSVALSAPSDGANTERVDSATLAWSAMSGAEYYQIKVNSDHGFKGIDYSPADTKMTSVRVTGLEDGQTYYWKVRVATRIFSRWSGVRSFNTALGAPQWNPFVGGVPEAPYNGATNVPLTPSFAWNPADWATGYEFVLAKDAAFSDVVVSKTGANALSSTVYLSEETLANSTTYYWKVRATSKTTDSEWASAVFTTEAKAPAPPAPPAPAPTPPAPEPLIAPIYLWVIIGIGAILVIALIILIVRTRRVA